MTKIEGLKGKLKNAFRNAQAVGNTLAGYAAVVTGVVVGDVPSGLQAKQGFDDRAHAALAKKDPKPN